jgi:KDO2-lipid IV(A) lauroyltransferase
MGAAGYYIFYSITWVITLLPLRVLYIFSDLIFLFAYYFPGYRKKVVEENLRNSFPEKTEKERRVIAKKFYRHFCDLIIEILKLVHMDNRQLAKRIPLTNPGLLDRLYNEGRDVAAIYSHYGNWEWTRIFPVYTKLWIVPIYKPLQNKYFDSFMFSLRSKNSSDPTPMSGIIRKILKNRQGNRTSLYGLISDQTPARAEIRFRTDFLSQDTPVFMGAEKIAAKYDMAVVYMNIQKIRRGYYSITAEMLFEHTEGLPEHLITETHVKRLEEIIREKPEYWLWTHRRWKYKREDANG